MMAVKFVLISVACVGILSSTFAKFEWQNDATPLPAMTTCAPDTECVNSTSMRNSSCLRDDKICMYAEKEGKPVCIRDSKCYFISVRPNLLPGAPPNSNLTTYEIPCLCPVGTFCDYKSTLNSTNNTGVMGHCVPYERPQVVISATVKPEVTTMITPTSAVKNKTIKYPAVTTCPNWSINPYRMKPCYPCHELICSFSQSCMTIVRNLLWNYIYAFNCRCKCPEGSKCLYQNNYTDPELTYSHLYYYCVPDSDEMIEETSINRASTAETVTKDSSTMGASLSQVNTTQNETEQLVTTTCAPGALCTADARKMTVQSCQNEPIKPTTLYSRCMSVFYNETHILQVYCPYKCPDGSTCLYDEDEIDTIDFHTNYICKPNHRDTPKDDYLPEISFDATTRTPENETLWFSTYTLPPHYNKPTLPYKTTENCPFYDENSQCSEQDVLCRLKESKVFPTCAPGMACMFDSIRYIRTYLCLCPTGTRCPDPGKDFSDHSEYFCQNETTAMETQELPDHTKEEPQSHQCNLDEPCVDFYQGFDSSIRSCKTRCTCPNGLTCRPRHYHRSHITTPTLHYCSTSVRNITTHIAPHDETTLASVTEKPLCTANDICLFVIHERFTDTFNIPVPVPALCKGCPEGFICKFLRDHISQAFYRYTCQLSYV